MGERGDWKKISEIIEKDNIKNLSLTGSASCSGRRSSLVLPPEAVMADFSSQTLETLIDLVEIKLSYLDVTDREDRLEFKRLQHALVELGAARGLPRSTRRQAAPAALHP